VLWLQTEHSSPVAGTGRPHIPSWPGHSSLRDHAIERAAPSKDHRISQNTTPHDLQNQDVTPHIDLYFPAHTHRAKLKVNSRVRLRHRQQLTRCDHPSPPPRPAGIAAVRSSPLDRGRPADTQNPLRVRKYMKRALPTLRTSAPAGLPKPRSGLITGERSLSPPLRLDGRGGVLGTRTGRGAHHCSRLTAAGGQARARPPRGMQMTVAQGTDTPPPRASLSRAARQRLRSTGTRRRRSQPRAHTARPGKKPTASVRRRTFLFSLSCRGLLG
jgi:hypothetical protein